MVDILEILKTIFLEERVVFWIKFTPKIFPRRPINTKNGIDSDNSLA